MFINSKILKASFIVLLALVASTDVMARRYWNKGQKPCPKDSSKKCLRVDTGHCKHALLTKALSLNNTGALMKHCDDCKKVGAKFAITTGTKSPDSFCVDKNGDVVQKNGADVSNANTQDSDNTQKDHPAKDPTKKERW